MANLPDRLDQLHDALSDRYRLERELGQGGMATVYLAHDLKHERKVAVKVLRPELAAVIGAERFLSEIKTTANLQHPHILPLFDSGEADGFLFYVMPYIEGETVRDRLNREKQLPIPDAVRIATEVAAALDYAHRRNVIHRDIKPENILLHDGSALVADFGIALAASKAGGTRMTETGMSLGTPHYMSPEQAMGEREITARSDVYALGCVTYEMLTGDPPFTGSTAQAIVARVVTESPRAMVPQRHTIPPAVEDAVLTALEKLPADRWGSAAEFAEALAGGGKGGQTRRGERVPAMTARPGSIVLVAVLSVALILATALALWGWLRPPPPRGVVRYSMGIPPAQAMRQGALGVNLAISPDGRRMVYVGPGDGGDQLWVRERDRLDATPLPGTVGALNPFFSPDGKRIGYSSTLNVELKVVPVAGGPPITLASPGTGAGGGGAWGPDGWIYFDAPPGLSRIQADGGSSEVVTPLDSTAGEVGQAWPDALPNGKGLIYRSRRNLDPSTFDIVAYDFATHQRRILTRGLLARYVAPGYLVFLRADGAVLAAPFDQDHLKLTGPAVPLFEGVMTKSFGSADIAISRSGTLAYVPGLAGSAGGVAELVTVTREGLVSPFNPPVTYNPAANAEVSLSPDGRRAALDVIAAATPDIWIKQLPAGPLSRLTFDAAGAHRPSWTSDGQFVVYHSTLDSGMTSIWKQKADGSAPPVLLWRGRGGVASTILSPDGQWLIFPHIAANLQRGIYGIRPGRDTVPAPMVAGQSTALAPAVSPNGKWLAYTSDESGRYEIFVRPFPNTTDGHWQISTAGGRAPRWSHSGRELFYEVPPNDLMVAPVAPGPGFAAGAPRRLFSVALLPFNTSFVPLYDVTPDDKRFVMVRLAEVNQAPGAGQLVVVDNWIEELEGRMGSK